MVLSHPDISNSISTRSDVRASGTYVKQEAAFIFTGFTSHHEKAGNALVLFELALG